MRELELKPCPFCGHDAELSSGELDAKETARIIGGRTMRVVNADALAMKLRHMGYMDDTEEIQEVIDRFAEECDGDSISRQAAITLPVMPKEHREYQTFNLDDAYEQGWNDLQKCIESLPSVEPERKTGKWIRITQGAIPEKYICPFCHREVESYGVEELLPIRYPFCHCGADMRGKEE